MRKTTKMKRNTSEEQHQFNGNFTIELCRFRWPDKHMNGAFFFTLFKINLCAYKYSAFLAQRRPHTHKHTYTINDEQSPQFAQINDAIKKKTQKFNEKLKKKYNNKKITMRESRSSMHQLAAT